MKKMLFLSAALMLLTASASMAQDDSAQQNAASAQKNAADVQQKAQAEQRARITQERTLDTREKARVEQERANDISRKLNDKLNDYDEIIIKRKDTSRDDKVTVEIKNDEVFVNGIPIDEFVDEAVSVRVRSPKRYQLIAPGSPFRYPRSSWSLENGNMYNGEGGNGAFLGVLTEGVSNGARITSVTDNSAAEKAGLKEDDVITKVDGKSINSHEQLSALIGDKKPDEKVKVTYLRDGKEKTTTVKLGKRPGVQGYRRQYLQPGERPEPLEPLEPMEPREPMEPNEPIAPLPPMQFHFDDLGDRFQRAFPFEGKPRIGIRAQDTEDGKGAKVLSVDENSAAEKAGLKKDDIITSFDGKTINDAGDLADASRAAKDKSSVSIKLKRDGKSKDIELKIPRKLRTADL